MTSHDALVGYWDPPKGNTDITWDPDPDDLDYLSAGRRNDVLLGRLMSHFSIGYEAGTQTCSLAMDGTQICQIGRPSLQLLSGQMTWLRAYADLRGDRANEILLQSEDIFASFSAVRPLDQPSKKHSAELLGLTQDLAIFLEMQVKHLCRSPRPSEFSDQLHPIIDVPDHSTYPSGHSTEAFAIATVLSHIERAEDPIDAVLKDRQIFLMAHRIAVNRTVAGVHYPVDSAAGAALGCAIGSAVAALAGLTDVKEYSFDPETKHPIDYDFDRAALPLELQHQASGAVETPDSMLKRMAYKASGEWNTPKTAPST